VADSTRVKRLAGQIKQEVAGILQSRLQDPRLGMVTITDVKLSKDLGYADIYVTFLSPSEADESKDSKVELLRKASSMVRSELSRRLKLRATPVLRFHFDSLSEDGPRLERLIGEANKDRRALDDSEDDSE